MGDYNHMINIILSIISNESSLIESSLNDNLNSIVYFDNSHIKDIEFIKNDKLEYYELFELFENENNKIIKKQINHILIF